jgi:hypothetical protein
MSAQTVNPKPAAVTLYASKALVVGVGAPAFTSPDIDASQASQLMLCVSSSVQVGSPSLQWYLYGKDPNGHYAVLNSGTTAMIAPATVWYPVVTTGLILPATVQLQAVNSVASSGLTVDVALVGR